MAGAAVESWSRGVQVSTLHSPKVRGLKPDRDFSSDTDALLQKYAYSGITSVESLEILKVDPFTQRC